MGSLTLRLACRRSLVDGCGRVSSKNRREPDGYRGGAELADVIRKCDTIHHFCINGEMFPTEVEIGRFANASFFHMYPFRNYDDWAISALKQINDRGGMSNARRRGRRWTTPVPTGVRSYRSASTPRRGCQSPCPRWRAGSTIWRNRTTSCCTRTQKSTRCLRCSTRRTPYRCCRDPRRCITRKGPRGRAMDRSWISFTSASRTGWTNYHDVAFDGFRLYDFGEKMFVGLEYSSLWQDIASSSPGRMSCFIFTSESYGAIFVEEIYRHFAFSSALLLRSFPTRQVILVKFFFRTLFIDQQRDHFGGYFVHEITLVFNTKIVAFEAHPMLQTSSHQNNYEQGAEEFRQDQPQ
ncbi:hypothetical protein ACHAW5_002006 [Stephanodiscus triporus]|uniref:Uncharacterized protein n=1 Tax=Stephanodiscus triporus TaxID=2934178 RepID=A0ABD3NX72_9STRA